MLQEIARLGRAFTYAGAGIRYLFAHERNARIHLALTIMAIFLAWGLGFSAMEWALLALTIGMVLVAEAMNTAIEALTDLVRPDFHPQAKVAKDVAAGGVLLAAILAVIIALFLYLPKLLSLFLSHA